MLVAGDIAAASQADETLTLFFVAGPVDLKNPVFQRAAAELGLACKFGASEEQLARRYNAEY